MQKRKRRNNRRSADHSYGSLEPRMMLAGDLDVERNLVINSDFEDADPAPFIAFADGDDSTLQPVKIRNITTSFSNIAVVDSTPDQIDSLAQDIATDRGETYVVSFDLRGATNLGLASDDTNTVEVLFDGDVIGEFEGGRRWQNIAIPVTASSDNSRLEFREASATSDGRGILLDNVSLAIVREVNVRNGSFENTEGDISDGATNDEIPVFTAIPNVDSTIIGVTEVPDAADGNNVLDLNTSSLLVDRVFTNIDTEVGADYFLTFDLRTTDGATEGNVRVRWDGDFAATFNSTPDWRTVGTFVQANSDFTTLLFRENNSLSGTVQIDDIRLYKVASLATDYAVDLNDQESGLDNTVEHTENIRSSLANDISIGFTNGDILRSATVRVLEFTGSEVLSVSTLGTPIQSSFNTSTGILRLTGRAPVSAYEDVLSSLAFNDSNDNPTELTREVVVLVTDGTTGSDRSSVAINVTPVNDAPVIENINDVEIDEDTSTTVNVAASDVDHNDVDIAFEIEVTGDTFIFDELPTIGANGDLILNVVEHGSAWINITATDPDDASSNLSFGVEVPFVAPTGEIPDDFVQFSGQGQLSDTLPELRNNIYDGPPEMTIDTNLNYQAIIETADGDIVIDLFAAESPITVNNFVNLAEDGFYDGLTFHRVIEDFVAQGGDPTGLGIGGPGYEFEDELDNGLEFTGPGQLAMANSGPDTNGSQFFFTLSTSPTFAGEHTIFGEVIEGMDVLNQVNFVNNGNGTAEVIQRVRINIV